MNRAKIPADYHQVVNDIKGNEDIIYVKDIFTFYDIDSRTFYRYYPNETEGNDAIKDAIIFNRTLLKHTIRKKLLDTHNATALIFLYRLIADEEELAKMGNYLDYKTSKQPEKDSNIEIKIS